MRRDWNQWRTGFIGLLLISVAFAIPFMFEKLLFSIIVDIRQAINTGDSGHIILASARYCFIVAAQNIFIISGINLMSRAIQKNRQDNILIITVTEIIAFGLILYTMNEIVFLQVELVTTIFSATIANLLIYLFYNKNTYFERNILLYFQVYFAFQWLNVIPELTKFKFGVSDIPYSIKMTTNYLQSGSVIAFIGWGFFVTLFFSSIITSILFVIYDRNVMIATENLEKEKALHLIRSKVIQNRVYEEIHTLTHDLKTPLVTIQGLNSLISISSPSDKAIEYTKRIEGAVSKMSEMISSFLYESSKQKILVDDVIDYVRAQIPVEDEQLKFSIDFPSEPLYLYVNRIRVARALINIIENAMIVPTYLNIKEIKIIICKIEEVIVIKIIDNGIGISEDKLKIIWEIGYSTNQTTGLGLAFAKKVIEDNGGTIAIDSIVNIGTTVTIQFPDEKLLDEEEMYD